MDSLSVVFQVASILEAVHIVFVPGIETQPPSTWDKHENDNHHPVHWIEDFLPTDLPTATILKFRYENNLTWTNHSIENHGKNLLLQLDHFRASREKKSQPIIFIGHSLGGLIIKQALATSFQNQYHATYGEIARATKGIVFLGTPHSSRHSLVKQLDDIVRANLQGTDCIIHKMGVVHLASDILDGFGNLTTWMTPWLKIISFFEELPVPGQENPVVGPDDAEIPGHSKLPIHAHHLDISRLRSRTSAAYMQIVASIKSIWQLRLAAACKILPLSVSRRPEGLRGIPDAAAGTCNWILDSDPFRTWLQHDSGILWLKGIPGSGKTVLSASVVQKLLNRPASFGLSSATSFYFFSFGHGGIRHTGNDVINFLRHLMAYPQEKEYDIDESFTRSSKLQETEEMPIRKRGLLSKQVDTSPATVQDAPLRYPIIMFIDGLDESEESDTVSTFIWTILSRLPALYSLRVFISSRLQPQLTQVPQIRLEDNNTIDITRYCHSRLMTNDVAYRDFLAKEIVSRANGVFLWVKLVVSQLGHLHSRVDIGQVRLPSDLSEAFGWTMNHIMKKGKNAYLAQSLLRWAMFSRRPLSIYEVQHAIGTTSFICSQVCERCSEKGDGMKKLCFLEQDELNSRHVITGIEILTWGLLEVVDDTVCFAHYSVKDHLLRMITIQERPDTSHQGLALTCLEYLRTAISDLGDTLEKDQKPTTSIYPFLEYATFYWMYHLRLSGTVSEVSTTQDILQDFMSPTSDFRDGWITIYNHLSPNPKRFSRRATTPLHIICCFDIPVPSNKACETFSQYHDARDHAGRTPLSLACEMGHAELCNSLVLMGADFRIRDEVYGQTALGWAIAEGHKDIVRLLLHRGADPEDHLSGTAPLHLAIQRFDIALVELLLQYGADPRTLDNHTGSSALSLASSLGNTSIVSLLLNWGAETLGKDRGNGWTPLHHAIFKGRQSALKTLISSLSDSQIQDLKYRHIHGPISWVERVLSYSLGGMCCHGSGRSTSLQSSAPSGMDSERRNAYSGWKCGKRRGKQTRNNSNYGDEDGDEDGDDSRPGGSTPSDGVNGHPRFACPYEKVCQEENRCSPSGFPSMYRVKTHVLSKHEIKRCWTCCRPFREEVELRSHARSCDHRELPIQYEKGFDGTQRDEIKATKTADFRSEADHWRCVFKLCFPSWGSDIPDPYHNDIGARVLSEETLSRIIEIGSDRVALRHYLSRIVESSESAVANIGQVSTLRVQRQLTGMGPVAPTLSPTTTNSVNWQTPINYEQPSATASRDTPYTVTNSLENRTPTYAPLVPRPNCTSADGSLTGFSGTSGPSHPRDFTNSVMDQSINSPEPGHSIDGDQFSLPSRSDTSNHINARHQDMFMGAPQGRGFATAGLLAAPSVNTRGGTTGAPTPQRGDRRANPGTGFQTYITPQIGSRDYPGQAQHPITWDLNNSHRAIREPPTGSLPYTAYPTSPNYPLGGGSYGRGPNRNLGGMQQDNTESQDVPMNLYESPQHFAGHESRFPSYD
ncbi:hypothetical protein F4818DRAFT_435491 [Hypoxylon cercidicola]|nr:hypothetical protein F4818DRAFT_435491 [Hypoxylon cercidicola]